MKKLIMAAMVGLSISSLAATHLDMGDLEYKKNLFMTKSGITVDGEYKISDIMGKSIFSFRGGNLENFEYDGKGRDDLEIEGKFVKDKYFRGEVSIEKRDTTDSGKEIKEEISLDGNIESQGIFQFAKSLLTKKSVKEPTFSEINLWKVQDGKKEIEKKKITEISKNTKDEKYSSYRVDEMEKKEVYSDGKMIHTQTSNKSKTESRMKKS